MLLLNAHVCAALRFDGDVVVLQACSGPLPTTQLVTMSTVSSHFPERPYPQHQTLLNIIRDNTSCFHPDTHLREAGEVHTGPACAPGLCCSLKLLLMLQLVTSQCLHLQKHMNKKKRGWEECIS